MDITTHKHWKRPGFVEEGISQVLKIESGTGIR
jgi:hypothetical protein